MRGAFLAVKRSPFLRAVGYVAFFGAMQPKDIGLLPEALLDLDAGLVRFPRGKTGVGRICHLPPFAVLAVRKWLAVRPSKCLAEAEGLLFRTNEGRPCYREPTGEDAGCRTDAISRHWSAVTGLPVSGLRSTYATIADAFPDQRAVDTVMGHKSGHESRKVRSKHYAKRVDPERVKSLARYVWPLAMGRKA
jgi:integrase